MEFGYFAVPKSKETIPTKEEIDAIWKDPEQTIDIKAHLPTVLIEEILVTKSFILDILGLDPETSDAEFLGHLIVNGYNEVGCAHLKNRILNQLDKISELENQNGETPATIYNKNILTEKLAMLGIFGIKAVVED